MKIHVLPIEPFEDRYSMDYLRWFKDDRFENIMGDESYNKIQTGEFLDVFGTNEWKLTQLNNTIKKLKSGEILPGSWLLLTDGWYPGIETVAYIRDAMGLDIKIAAMMHAGCYDPNDFIVQKGMHRWGINLERSWFQLYDLIFVATDYHESLIVQTHPRINHKIKITGFPLFDDFLDVYDIQPVPFEQREKLIVFPHRLAPEKRPELFDELSKDKQLLDLGFKFIKTKDVINCKKDYYEILAKSMFSVSFALQETFGIAMAESVLCGAIPVVPDDLAYHELYYPVFQYKPDIQINNIVSIVKNKILAIMEFGSTKDFLKFQSNILTMKGERAIPNMINEMNNYRQIKRVK